MAKKPPIRMNRRTFWTWAIPIVLAHMVLTYLITNTRGGTTGPWGGFDTILLVFLATALARRFRDIGWPVWTGPTFVVVTMVVIPMGVFGYAFASHPSTQDLLQWISSVGMVTGPLNLLLILVAGCVPGRPDLDAEIRAE